MSSRAVIAGLVLLALTALSGASTVADGPVKITFATNWKAEAEHGGLYQAVAAGIYRKHRLDVTIRMGRPPGQQRPARATYWNFLRAKFGFTEDPIRP